MQISNTWRAVFSKRMLVVLLQGFSSGLPLLLTGGTLKTWMRNEGLNLSLIGIFALVGLPYTLKFVWAPLMDRFVPPFLGRRRGWLLIWQIGLVFAIGSMALVRPSASLSLVAVIACFITFFSASQDIVVDAYRREILSDNELGFGSSLAVNGYRIGLLCAGAVALGLSDNIGWGSTYIVMASLMIVGILTTFWAEEPVVEVPAPHSFRGAVVEPFIEYFSRHRALEILVFILLFKIGDQMASDMLNPFYVDMGFTNTEIGYVSKVLGLTTTILGGLIGGILLIRIGLVKGLWIFGALQAISTFCFVFLAKAGAILWVLGTVVSIESFTSGMGTAAFVGYMASLCNKRFTATQYALLSSLMGVPRVIFGSTSGLLAEKLGWTHYFIFCTLIAVPGLLLLLRVAPWNSPSTSRGESL